MFRMQDEGERMGHRSRTRQSYGAHVATRLLLHRLRANVHEEEAMQASHPGGRRSQQNNTLKGSDIGRGYPGYKFFLERIGYYSSCPAGQTRPTGHRRPQAGCIVFWWAGDRRQGVLSCSTSSEFSQLLPSRPITAGHRVHHYNVPCATPQWPFRRRNRWSR